MTDELRQLTIDMKHTFGSEHGKRVLENLKMKCHANWTQSVYGSDPYETAYNEGARCIFGYIMHMMEMKFDENVSRETCQTEEPTERT